MKFKLYLLTPVVNNNETYFLRDIITDFNDQSGLHEVNQGSDITSHIHTHQYTYNEKVKFDVNSKKTLSFSLSKKLWINDDWIENPFLNAMQVGNLLLLEDAYTNHHIFIITSVKYAFGSVNVTYNISCEDFFSYSTTRQNNGYFIENSSDDGNFIGSYPIDYWVNERIKKDCKPSYEYLDFQTGWYEDFDGNFNVFTRNQNGKMIYNNIKRIIKESYPQHNFPEYYKDFLFTCSNSSTNGALVSLGQLSDMQIVTFEHVNANGELIRKFWFEPLKNENRINDLVYRPTSSLSALSLTQSGKSLTTVLNVEGPTDDEHGDVTLFPPLPAFFFQKFQSRNWKTNSFEDNSFSKMLEPYQFFGSIDDKYKPNTDYDFSYNLETVIVSKLQPHSENYVTTTEKAFFLKNLNIWKEKDILTTHGFLSFKDDILQVQKYTLDPDTGDKVYSQDEPVALAPSLQTWELWLVQDINYIPRELRYTQVSQYTQGNLSEDGTTIVLDPYSLVSDYIDSEGSTSYKVTNLQGTAKDITFYAYNENKVKIGKSTTNSYTTPSNTRYIRFVTSREDAGLFLKVTSARKVKLIKSFGSENREVLNIAQSKDLSWFLYIDSTELTDKTTIFDQQSVLNLYFTHPVSSEEKEFAAAADRCPWLENKLIDFSYFKDQNIISESEYRNLTHIIYHDLRIANGELMCFSQAYYNALHQKTKILATLNNNLESLGAACQASIIEPFETSGVVSDWSYFNSAYKNVFNIIRGNEGQMFDYNKTLTDYFNKYVSASQRFLKNIYQFRKFFESPASIPGTGLYEYEYKMRNDDVPHILPSGIQPVVNDKGETTFDWDWSYDYYGFSNQNATTAAPLDTEFYDYVNNPDEALYGKPNVVIYSENRTATTSAVYTPVSVVHKGNVTDFYRLREEDKTPKLAENYDSETKYYKIVFTIDWTPIIEDNNFTKKFDILPTNTAVLNAQDANYRGMWRLIPSSDSTLYKYINDGTTDIYDDKLMLNCISREEAKTVGHYNLTFAFKTQDKTIVDAFRKDEEWKKCSIRPSKPKGYSYDKVGWNSSVSISDATQSLTNATVKYQAVTINEIINNWLCLASDTAIKKIYVADYNNHFLSVADFISVIGEKIYTETIKNSDDSETEIPHYFSEIFNINKENRTELNNVPSNLQAYLDCLPINELYWKGWKSKINDSEDATTIIAYDQQGHAFDDLKETAKKPPAYMVPINFINEKNSSKFYRRVYEWTGGDTAMVATASTLMAVPFVNFFTGIPALIAMAVWGATSSLRTSYSTDNEMTNSWNLRSQPIPSATGFINDCHVRYTPQDNGWEKMTALDKTEWEDTKYHLSTIYNNIAFTTNMLFYNFGHFTKSDYRTAWGDKPENQGHDSARYNYDDDLFNDLTDTVKNAIFGTKKDSSFFFQDDYWEMKKIDEVLNTKGDYYLLNLASFKDSNVDYLNGDAIIKLLPHIFHGSNKKQSGLIFYPILQQALPISLDVKEETIKARTMLGYLGTVIDDQEKIVPDTDSTKPVYSFFLTRYGTTFPFILLQRKKYSTDFINRSEISNQYNPQYYKSPRNLLDKYGCVYNFHKEKTLSNGYFFYLAETEPYEKIEHDTDFTLKDQNYFRKVDNVFEPIYTVEQLKNKTGYVIFNAGRYKETSFIKNDSVLQCHLIKYHASGHTHRIAKVSNLGNVTAKRDIISYYDFHIIKDVGLQPTQPIEWNETTPTNYEASVRINSGLDIVKIKVYCKTIEEYNTNNLNNGTFWFKYHTSANTLLSAQAAAIEAELTEYWSQAYSASKLCDFYLPEYWTNARTGQENKVFGLLFAQTDNGLEILKNILPNVRVIYDNLDATSRKFRCHRLPKTDTIYSKTTSTPSLIMDSNPALKSYFIELDEDPEDYVFEEIGSTTYYEATDGGLRWKDFIHNVLGHEHFERYSGLYKLMFLSIKEGYSDIALDSYTKAKQRHLDIWEKLYNHYGHVLIENHYKNSDATNSKELYHAAKYFLLDSIRPEKQYSVTITDISWLKGYQGEELRLGDPIEIDADSFYNKNDLIYRALREYLFISNISYDLRNPSGLSITVNNIRYKDKLIDRLASLIK